MQSNSITKWVLKGSTNLLCFLIINFSFAQKAEFIKGMWTFKEIENKKTLDSLTLKYSDMLFNSWEMEFGENGKYTHYKSLNGKWAFDKDSTKIITTIINPTNPNQQKTSEYKIKALSSKQLILDMGKVVVVFGRPPVQIVSTNNSKKVIQQNSEVNKNVEKSTITNANPIIPKPTPTQTAPAKDPTVFVKRLNDFIVFKEEDRFGLKDNNNKIIFPAVLALIDQGEMQGSFEVGVNGYYMAQAYFSIGGFTGDMNCDVCHGSGFIGKDYFLSKETKTAKYSSYLGGGVWEEIKVTTTTPPSNVRVNAKCTRCSGLGKMRGGINYANGNLKIWNWADELEKSRK